MKIYISIPMTGRDLNEQRERAREAEMSIYMRGHIPFNPFNVQAPEGMGKKETYAYYMGRDIEALLRCDAILMADNVWHKSKGCKIEYNAASVMNIKIFHDIADIPDNNGDKSNETDGR